MEIAAADHPLLGTGSQSHKGWKGAIAAPERLYLPNCKQASLLRLLGVLDSHHLLTRGASGPPRKLSNRGRKGDKSQQSRSPNSWATRTREGHNMQSQPNLCLWGLPERLRPGKCTQPRAGLRRIWAEHRRAGAVCAPREGTGPAGLRHCVHTTVLFVCNIPPPHSATELVSLKNQQTEDIKQREPPWKWSHMAHDIREGPREGPDLFLLFLKSFLFFFCCFCCFVFSFFFFF